MRNAITLFTTRIKIYVFLRKLDQVSVEIVTKMYNRLITLRKFETAILNNPFIDEIPPYRVKSMEDNLDMLNANIIEIEIKYPFLIKK